MASEPKSFSLSSSPGERKKSALWALAIAAPLCLWGWSASMGLAHSGGALLLLFAPTFPVFLLFGSGGVFEGAPEWALALAAALSEYAGVFVVTHAIRLALVGNAQRDA